MKEFYNPKESFDKYLNSARYCAESKNNDAMLKDMLCALEELQAWMEKVEEKLSGEK
jgi:hypothetical protein